MKILLCYINHKLDSHYWYQQIARNAPSDLQVDTFCISLPHVNGRISWNELNLRVNLGCPYIMRLYKRLLNKAKSYDVIWNYNGSMLHPYVLDQLNCTRVLSCFDDPEDYYDLVSPVYSSYDLVLYGNYASKYLFERLPIDSYWLPIFTQPAINKDALCTASSHHVRDIDIIFIGGITGFSDYRKQRLLKLKKVFPAALCIGRGWESGYDETLDIPSLYLRAKVGWNVHRSIGPVNERTFDLSAYGVAQVCDNHFFLKNIFASSEVLGFSTIDEAIHHTRLLLANSDYRANLALNAQKRYFKEYSVLQIWSAAVSMFASACKSSRKLYARNNSTKFKPISTLPVPFTVSSKLWRVFSGSQYAFYKFIAFIRDNQYRSYQVLKMSDYAYLASHFDYANNLNFPQCNDSVDIPEYVFAGCMNLLPSSSHVHVIKSFDDAVTSPFSSNFILMAYSLLLYLHAIPRPSIKNVEGLLIIYPSHNNNVSELAKATEMLTPIGMRFSSSYFFPFAHIPWLHCNAKSSNSKNYSVLRYIRNCN